MTTTTTAGLGPRPDWLTRDAFPFTSRYVDVDGDRIHYIDEGAGPALVLVTDGMWSFVFRDLIDRLRSEFRVIALDFPGLGLSIAAPGRVTSVAADSATLEGFVDRIGLTDAILFLHDIGGPVGLGLARRRPELVRGLVLCQTFAFPLRDDPAIERMLRVVSSRPMRALDAATGLLSRLTSTSFGVGRHLSSADRRAFRGPWRERATRRRTIDTLGSGLGIDDELAAIESALTTTLADRPVLTVFGERNDPQGWQERYAGMLPQAHHHTVPGGNHFPFADDPDGVAAAIVDWYRAELGADTAGIDRATAS